MGTTVVDLFLAYGIYMPVCDYYVKAGLVTSDYYSFLENAKGK